MAALNVSRKQRIRYWKSKWPLANLLNRSSRTCWSDLVTWALHEKTGDPSYDEGRLLLDSISGGSRCREESETHRDHSCYCGKFTNGCLTRKGQTPGDVT